jgi:hypothetical protein
VVTTTETAGPLPFCAAIVYVPLATLLAEKPLATAIAFMVVVVETAMGLLY